MRYRLGFRKFGRVELDFGWCDDCQSEAFIVDGSINCCGGLITGRRGSSRAARTVKNASSGVPEARSPASQYPTATSAQSLKTDRHKRTVGKGEEIMNGSCERAECGRAFERRNERQRFCSNSCRTKNWRDKQTVRCPRCEHEFNAERMDRKEGQCRSF